MRQIVITPVTGRLRLASTEMYKLFVEYHRNLFGDEFPSVTQSNKVVTPLLREVSEEELRDITQRLVNTGYIESVHIEEMKTIDDDEIVY